MQLEEYFEFEKFPECDRIRVKGTRVSIDIIIQDWKEGFLPEQIVSNHRTLTLEQVLATRTYYLHNRPEVDAYIQKRAAAAEANYQEYLKQEPSPVMKRLRAVKAQREGAKAD
jgi:uncharacterized protein (DUF433 family)